MIIVGKQAIDGDNCQTGPMVRKYLKYYYNLFNVLLTNHESNHPYLIIIIIMAKTAALLGWPQCTFAASLNVAEGGKVHSSMTRI